MKKLLLLLSLLFSVNGWSYISVENLNEPLEEDVIISSENWDKTAKTLFSYGEYDSYLRTVINKNDLSVRTSVVISAVFPDAFPSFSSIKYVDTQGKPATKDMWSAGTSFQDQYQMECTLNYKTKYQRNPFFTANCYRETSRSSSFNLQQVMYFYEKGFRIKVSGSTDLIITFRNEEVSAHIKKINDVKSILIGEISQPKQ